MQRPTDLQPTTSDAPRRGVNIKLSFVDANPQVRIEKEKPADAKMSYFLGNNQEQWRSAVPVWRSVRYVGLYPDIDLIMETGTGGWEWRFEARPGADLLAARLRIEGASAAASVGGHLC
jgi:hypothetical protein